jgi:hypothetical protein
MSGGAAASSASALLDRIRSLRCYFGHQSVGRNILSGVESIASGRLRIVDLDQLSCRRVEGPAVYHSRIGKNQDPFSKIAAFESTLDDLSAAGTIEVALMKLCYVDIYPHTDVKAVFLQYQNAVARLETRFPKLKLIHTTVPLTIHGGSFKKVLKNLLKGDRVNIARAEYNQLVREAFGVKGENLFDIAAVESTRADGTRECYTQKGMKFEALCREFSSDGGHLNRAGCGQLALEFLRRLDHASISE